MHDKINPLPQNIIISGASSGIGQALALEYASSGITLGLIGRNSERLKHASKLCKEKGATVVSLSHDIKEHSVIESWVKDFNSKHPVDLVVSNAGISGGTGRDGQIETLDDIKEIYDVNVMAAIFFGQCLYEDMKQRGHGQIAFTGSIAGFRGWAGAPAYTSSKSAIHTYAESLRMLGSKHNIKVNIIAPGFVESRMTDQNEFPMPFKLTSTQAAKIIKRGLEKNKRYIIFPFRMHILSLFSRCLPEIAINFIASKMRGKSEIKLK